MHEDSTEFANSRRVLIFKPVSDTFFAFNAFRYIYPTKLVK